MKRKREINEEREEKDSFRKQQNRRIHTILDELPDDILVIIIQRVGLLEKHILRFVCKKTHRIVHDVSLSPSIKFHGSGKDWTSWWQSRHDMVAKPP
jgi:hypothetical protein